MKTSSHTLRLLVALFLLAASALVPVPRRTATAQSGCEYWVAPTGSNGNPGTFAQPRATLDYASARVLALGAATAPSGSSMAYIPGWRTACTSVSALL